MGPSKHGQRERCKEASRGAGESAEACSWMISGGNRYLCCFRALDQQPDDAMVAPSQPKPAMQQQAKPAPQIAIRTPEGAYPLFCERRGSYAFQPELATQLTPAELAGESSSYLVLNVGQKLHVYPAAAVDKDPVALVHFTQPGNSGPACYPTCHSHTQTLDEYDLLVGLSTGEVVLMSLRAQLRAGGTLSRAVTSISINFDGCVNSSRCVAAAWVPGSQGRSFITAHRDGGVFLHHKVVGNSSDSKLLARTNSQQSLRPPATALQPAGAVGVTAVAPSPDGSLVAVACKDGVLRLYDIHSQALVAGFKSYYGGLLCCAWSPDGRYVAAGGEDDLVSVYGLTEHCVVAVGQGHSSWVSQVAFDPWMCHPIQQPAAGPMSPRASFTGSEGGAGAGAMDLGGQGATAAQREMLYRLASVGQDCQILLWDVVVSEDTLAATPGGLSPFRSSKEAPASAATSSSHRVHAGGGVALPACIASSLPRAEFPLMPAVAQQRIHLEPLSDVLFTSGAMLTACHAGSVKVWRRPAAPTASAPALMDVSEG